MPSTPQIGRASGSTVRRRVWAEMKVMIGTAARIFVGIAIGVAVCVALMVALFVDLFATEAHT